jgi:hypothetical protein
MRVCLNSLLDAGMQQIVAAFPLEMMVTIRWLNENTRWFVSTRKLLPDNTEHTPYLLTYSMQQSPS